MKYKNPDVKCFCINKGHRGSRSFLLCTKVYLRGCAVKSSIAKAELNAAWKQGKGVPISEVSM